MCCYLVILLLLCVKVCVILLLVCSQMQVVSLLISIFLQRNQDLIRDPGDSVLV